MFKRQFLSVILILAICIPLFAQAEQYGTPVNVETAKKAAAAAVAEAKKNNFTMAIAIVDPNGTLVYFEKMDNTQNGSAAVALDKARSAALFMRPTKAFQDTLAAGGEGFASSRCRVRFLLMADCRSLWRVRSSAQLAPRVEPAPRMVRLRRPAPMP